MLVLLKIFYLLVDPVRYSIKQILNFLVMDLKGVYVKYQLGSCLLIIILDAQFYFCSDISFHLKNAVKCLEHNKWSMDNNSFTGRIYHFSWMASKFLMGTYIPGNSIFYYLLFIIYFIFVLGLSIEGVGLGWVGHIIRTFYCW